MTKVMEHGIRLRRTLGNTPLDHSALLALARSILDTLSVESPHLTTLQHCAQTFNDLVTLTSGLGLFDVWSSLYTENSSETSKELICLDELATSLNNDADRTGMLSTNDF